MAPLSPALLEPGSAVASTDGRSPSADRAEAVNGDAGDLVQPYELVSDHTFINGFQRVTFQIRGDHMILHMHIIKSLYPYSPKELVGEHAYDVGAFMARPFARVN